MTEWAKTTATELIPELDHLRHVGLASFDVERVPLIGRLASEADYGVADAVTMNAVVSILVDAVGALDNGKFKTSTAYVFGIAEGQSRSLTVSDRMQQAGAVYGISAHGYSGRRDGGRRYEDLIATARQLVEIHRSAITKRLRAEQLSQGLAPMPDVRSIEPPDAVARHLDGQSADEWRQRRGLRSAELWAELLDERDRQLEVRGPLSDKLCMFASGSYGRDEAMDHSDLDMFLIDDAPRDDGKESRLDKFELGAALALIERARLNRDIQHFSQGGYYQEVQSFKRMLIEGGGKADGPSTLTTARSLLLVDSKCFWNEPLYQELRRRALDDYWMDSPGPTSLVKPTFLINDLRRTWLTMLVNFEHFFPARDPNGQRRFDPLRRIAGLKLAVPQRLGCYTPILALLERSTNEGLTRADADDVLRLTSAERLNQLADSSDPVIAESAAALRELYGQYMAFTWCKKEEMMDRVDNDWQAIKRHFRHVHNEVLRMLWAYHARIPEVARNALV